MNKKRLVIIIITLALMGGLYYLITLRQSENNLPKDAENTTYEENEEEKKKPDIAVGEAAPNFTLKNLDEKEVSLKDYRGKIVLINFWATWCKYCDIEMPDLQKLDKENEDLVVLAVDVQESKETVKNYIEKGGYDFEVVLDEEGEVAKMYLASAFPTSYFVDKDGTLLGGIPGMMEYAQMKKILESIRANE
ncbi:TlpA family protein disulfide reductase [Paramaledivibacter caminithermalis]|uniref:Peroxiredoxin n=1 Tax=Paramaledivibacter caminithermalis (strain DSM 15212 / CIP 107654 / DViRD3) TaxID=1121301 RepID=A0A1M6TER2_PARC5|nr:TlpA disulfide reductase family protein [Paramaledivibacter caminithermalis]SHK55441.1 Peroxiredoxin [Paramaledivibacter caminithermalis DSM 15212]